MTIHLPVDLLVLIHRHVDPRARAMFVEGVITKDTAAVWAGVSPETLEMLRDPVGYEVGDHPLTLGCIRAKLAAHRRTPKKPLFRRTTLPVTVVLEFLHGDDLSYYMFKTQDITAHLDAYAPHFDDHHWMLLCKYARHFSDDNVSRWKHRIPWITFTKFQYITETFATKYKDRISWLDLRRRSNLRLSNRFWKKNKHRLP